MFDFITNPTLSQLDPVLKLGFLILVGLYIIFAFMLLNKIRSFKRIITFERNSGIMLLQTFSYLFLLLLVFLFIAAVVIV
jgi:hypothetical protein